MPVDNVSIDYMSQNYHLADVKSEAWGLIIIHALIIKLFIAVGSCQHLAITMWLHDVYERSG